MSAILQSLRWLVVCSLAACSASTLIQAQAPEKKEHDWTRVEAIAAGTLVHVKTNAHNTLCRVTVVEAEQLRCEGGHNYARLEVKRVALSRRGVSASGMATLGAGVGAATTAIVSKAGGLDGSAKGSVWAGAAGLGAVIFAPIGFFGDPFRGSVVYTAR